MNMNQVLGIVFFTTTIFTSAQAGTTVYIPLGTGNMVIAVDAATDKIIAKYQNINNAHGLVATSDGEYLIAGSLNENQSSTTDPSTLRGNLYLVHPAHGHMMSAIPAVGSSHHQAITPDDKYVISTHSGRGSISFMDMSTYKTVKEIKTGIVPNYTIISKNGKYAYVSNTVSANISVIDLAKQTVVRSLESGPAPEHLSMSKDGLYIYVANSGKGIVSKVDIKSGKIVKSYKIGRAIHGLDISDDGMRLFVSSKKDRKLVAIDLDSNKQHEIKLSPSPYHLNTIKGTNKVYVSSRNKPIIWVIDQKSLQIINTITLPAGEGHQMAVVHD